MRICIVSTYPPSQGGVSYYAKSLVDSLRRMWLEVFVLSERLEDIDKLLEEKNVFRCWNRGCFYPFQIFRKLLRINADCVHIQHEFFLYGGLISAAIFPFLLALAKLLRKPAIVTLHGVVKLSEVNRQFLDENDVVRLVTLAKLSLSLVVRLIDKLSDIIIVHENSLARILERQYGCPKNKIRVIPHGVEVGRRIIPKDQAKEKMGLSGNIIILFFGYFARYKGIEKLIEAFGQLAKNHPDWVLVLAGGTHPRLRNNLSYERYVLDLKRTAAKIAPNQIRFAGFVDENLLPVLICAADIMVFPYRLFISSSGPLCLAASYLKPVLVSNALQQCVPDKDAIFDRLSAADLANKLERLLASKDLMNKVGNLLGNLAATNSWDKVAKKTAEIYEQITIRGT